MLIMETASISYAAISFIVIIGCIGTCMLSKCCCDECCLLTHENTEHSQTLPPYDNTDTSSTTNIQPPPYKFESSNKL